MMKLAEALMLRGDLQEKLSELRLRLSNNALVQEGELPAEDPAELLAQTETALKQLESLITRINLTNSTLLSDGRTMTALLAERDCLKQGISLQRSFLDSASMTGTRSRGSEIRLKSTVPVAELQKALDRKAQQLRKLDVRIQELNWITDLAEE